MKKVLIGIMVVVIFGIVLIDVTYVEETGSNHTVCHIPVTEVYQIPCGLYLCLPTG